MIIQIYSFFIQLYLYFKYRIKSKGTIFRCKFEGLKYNYFEIKGYLAHTSLCLKGNHNHISIKGKLLGCDIRVLGKNCKLIIEEGCKLQRTSIWLRGDKAEVIIGKETDIHPNARIVCQGNGNYIRIGKSCLLSSEVNVWNSDTHPIYNETGKIINPSKPIIIGSHVWIGRCVSIAKGVRVGQNSVIGMNTLVTKSVPNNVIVAGSPQRILKEKITWDSSKIEEVNFE